MKKIEVGRTYPTKLPGGSVRIICTNKKPDALDPDRPIVGLLSTSEFPGTEKVLLFREDGSRDEESDRFDLVLDHSERLAKEVSDAFVRLREGCLYRKGESCDHTRTSGPYAAACRLIGCPLIK